MKKQQIYNKMSTLSLSLVAFLCVFNLIAADQVVPFSYSCEVYGCHNMGTCDEVDGITCICQDGSFYNCMVEEADAKCSGCDPSNTASGSNADEHACLSETQCLCSEGFTGPTCAEKRLDVGCFVDHMTVSLHPYHHIGADTFNGRIFFNNVNDWNEATLQPDTPCSSLGAVDNMAFRGEPVGNECDLELTPAGSATQKIYAYIQHNPSFRSSADIVLELVCNADSNMADTTATLFKVSGNLQSEPLSSTHDLDGASGVSLTLKKMTDQQQWSNIAAESDINVGDQLALVFESDGTPFTVKNCQAAPSLELMDDAEFINMDLLDNWCVPPSALEVIPGPVVFSAGEGAAAVGGTEGKRMIRIDIKAFKFIGQFGLVFQCEVCVGCVPEVEGNVGYHACTNRLSSYDVQLGDPQLGRRKRAADLNSSGDDGGFNLEVSVQLDKQDSLISASVVQSSEDTGCYKQISVILPVSLLAALLLITLGLACYFMTRLTSDRKADHQDFQRESGCDSYDHFRGKQRECFDPYLSNKKVTKEAVGIPTTSKNI